MVRVRGDDGLWRFVPTPNPEVPVVTVTFQKILLVASILCFGVAWLIAANLIDPGNAHAWAYGGLTLFAASHL